MDASNVFMPIMEEQIISAVTTFRPLKGLKQCIWRR